MIIAATRAICVVWTVLLIGPALPAQEAAPAASGDKTSESLRDDQLAISGRYARFERMLSQMADILGRQDPERADLLRRAIGKGREDHISEDIENVVELLERRELGGASEQQEEIIESLQVLLKLLQSEDRRSSVERERERLNDLLKDVRGVINQQRSARAATQNAEAPSSAAPGQQKALEKTDDVLNSVREHDDQQSGSEKESDSNAEGASRSDQQSPGDSQSETPDSQNSKSPSENSTPKSDSQGSQSQQGSPRQNGQPSESQSQSQDSRHPSESKSAKDESQTPGREMLERAREQMQQALEQLLQQQREQALKKEDQALEALHAAAEKLEEMLRQLREEEKEMTLAALEARFQRMLIVETQIHEGTLSLAETPQADWLDQYYSRCRELAQQQSELALECAQTVNLLREDGTSAAVLLTVEDIEADMNSVSGWLTDSNVGPLTQSVQTDILDALRQLIEVTQQEMQDMKDQHQDPQQQQQTSKEKRRLIETIAEIRMLRNLQLQVNRRTKQVDELMRSASEQDAAALRTQLRDLASRQKKLISTAQELAREEPQ